MPFSLFLNYRLIPLNSSCYYTNFNQTAELVISTRIPTTDVKEEIDTHTAIVEAKICKYSSFLQVFLCFSLINSL